MIQAKWFLTLCVQNIANKNEALHGYVSPRVRPRELCRLEIVLKIIITVTTITFNGSQLQVSFPKQIANRFNEHFTTSKLGRHNPS